MQWGPRKRSHAGGREEPNAACTRWERLTNQLADGIGDRGPTDEPILQAGVYVVAQNVDAGVTEHCMAGKGRRERHKQEG